MPDIFIAGCGYIGERIARIYRNMGRDVTCMIRSQEHAIRLESEGFKTIIFSLDDYDPLPEMRLFGNVVFYLVPPPGGGIVDSRARNFIAGLEHAGKPGKIVYMSATSVYSESDGGVVTEESATAPTSAMGKRRLDAEAAFTAYGKTSNVPLTILRVSGIYGPGRLPLMQISQALPLLREEESGPSNRIHADDLVSVCLAAARQNESCSIFNVSDGHPSSMTTYFNVCADALKLPRQRQVTLEEARKLMSPLMFSYVSESRIVDNSRMMERLDIVMCYPDILEGVSTSVIS